jgi:hypothetical protein
MNIPKRLIHFKLIPVNCTALALLVTEVRTRLQNIIPLTRRFTIRSTVVDTKTSILTKVKITVIGIMIRKTANIAAAAVGIAKVNIQGDRRRSPVGKGRVVAVIGKTIIGLEKRESL